MTAPHGRLLNRGASILSALVFVALLAGAATTVQYLSPATAASRAAQVAASVETAKKTEKKCEAGEVNAILIQSGKVQPEAKVTKCWETKDGKRVKTNNTSICQDLDEDDCRVMACATKSGATKCEFVGEYDSTDPNATKRFNTVMATTDPKDIFSAAAEQGNAQGLIELNRASENAMGLDKQTQQTILGAFVKEQEAQIEQTKKEVNDARAQIQALGACAGAGEADIQPGGSCSPGAIEQAEKNLKQKQQNLAELEKQMKDLKEFQTTLKAPQQCPPNQTGTYPDCKPVSSNCGSNCNPGNPDRTGFGGSNPMGALGSLLSGLAKAVPPPAPAAAPAQACATDKDAYNQQQQQYQQQLQQYNYQLQQYQYQQQMAQYYAQQNGGITPPQQPPPAQPTPCTPSTGSQCQAQPQQPPPSACSAGYWRATYGGACITSWQCISTEGPKAELVCEPDLADVGQTLALTYNCSSGIASSSAFKITTQPGGSATTTVKAPPRGTNTATYTLACTDNGKTTGAQCSVKVNRPNIFLVTNPQTVAPGEISLISWLTTGMDSCIISSPDQADFTLRNSSNTSVTGAATTSPITDSARFLLHCETLAGGIKDATTTVEVSD